MNKPVPMMVVPMEVADELRRMREQIAALTEAVAPVLEDAKWMSIADAMEKFEASRTTINRWVQDGRLVAKGAELKWVKNGERVNECPSPLPPLYPLQLWPLRQLLRRFHRMLFQPFLNSAPPVLIRCCR